jgi:CRISPR-associated protein Cas5d
VGAVASKNPIYIEDKRQQKNSLLLKDVRYRIWAKLEFIPMRKRAQQSDLSNVEHPDENPAKYNAMFERRASKGQCFNQPYLGTRECVASFRLVNPESNELAAPINESRDLGIMLYDMDFEKDLKNPPAMFYRAKMENGVIIVPPKESKEILR